MRAWALLGLAGLVIEVRALRGKGVTLTRTTYTVFRVRTRIGKMAFLTFWVWFAIHILHRKAPGH